MNIKTGITRLLREQPGGYLLTGHAVFRCIGGVTLIRAFVWNLRTGPVMPRERHKWRTHAAESTNAVARGALRRSSEETGEFPWSEGGRSPASGSSQGDAGGTPCLDGRR